MSAPADPPPPARPPAAATAMRRAVAGWFDARGWAPFPFQTSVWRAASAGRSGLLHATTGAGKTYAVWLAALQAFAQRPEREKAGEAPAPGAPAKRTARAATPSRAADMPLTVLWITPMRALAGDTARALLEPVQALDLRGAGLRPWSVGMRTGDTGSAERAAQTRRLPSVLVTTPESLSLMLAREDAQAVLRSVRMLVVDEWHELIGNKRGVQVQLAAARLRGWNPDLRVWGMSATLGNLEEAMDTLLGRGGGTLVRGKVPKQLLIDTLMPARTERFSWAGHLGLRLLPQVVRELEASRTALVFANTRAQCELWYKALLDARPDWAGLLALHHGSLDRAVREWVEAGLKSGSLKAVVCTSSLDLGVDFLPVERVLQIGSPKGVARLLQRAGRSGHAPGRPSRITLVPTHSLELVEAAAARAAVKAARVEVRRTPQQPVDVLVQHLVTVALGGGFRPGALYAEVRGTHAYRDLTPEVWQWCLDFVSQGGPTLAAYPEYRRAVPDGEGVWRVPDPRIARRHRSNIGTIVSEAAVIVQVQGGSRLGSVEESFIGRMKPGDCFVFAGRVLELVKIEQMTAYVRRAPPGRATVPRWSGTRMPLSSVLAEFLVAQMALADDLRYDTPELRCVRPLLEVQKRWSALPDADTLLAETLRSREGWHLFLYPFAGRHAHMGLASLLAWRASQHKPGTFSIAINDYGLELLSAQAMPWESLLPELLRTVPTGMPGFPEAFRTDAPDGGDPERTFLLHEVLESLNATELARRRFREIARVSGLIFQSHPGEHRSARQLQASSQLFFDVFRRYDADNMLLRQADQEVLSQELDIGRLLHTLRTMERQRLSLHALERPGPFAFPLMIERFREKLTNEGLADRIARMVQDLEQAAGDPGRGGAAITAHLPDDLAVATEEVRQMLAFSLDTHGAESPPRKRLRDEPAPPDPAAEGDTPRRWRPKGRNRGPSKPLPRL